MLSKATINIKNSVLSILCFLIVVLLIGYMIAGWQSRYLADDYCYDAEFIKHGFLEGQIDSYLNQMPYSSNRYSLTFFSGVAWKLGGVQVMPILPALSIILWCLSIFYSIKQGSKFANYRLSNITNAFVTFTILFFTILLAPNQYQILFWRSGMLPYLFPLVINTFLLGRFFYYLQRNHLFKFGLIELGLLAWVAAGFSETIFAFQTGFWTLMMIIMIWRREAIGRNAAVAILLGSLTGAVLLIFNPTNAVRQSPFPPPPNIMNLALISMQFALDFIVNYLRSTPLPILILFSMGILLGLVEYRKVVITWRRSIIVLIGSVIATGILMICIMAPTVWSMSSFPEQRSLLAGVYLINIVLLALGCWLGILGSVLLQKFVPNYIYISVCLIAMVLQSAYLIHFIPSTYNLISVYENRAEMWDTRNAQILKARDEGQTQLVIPGIDSIAKIFELQPKENHWVNRCAAEYYFVEEIKTTE